MKWLLLMFTLYITYYTLMFAKKVWSKEKNRFAASIIGVLALSIPVVFLILDIP